MEETERRKERDLKAKARSSEPSAFSDLFSSSLPLILFSSSPLLFRAAWRREERYKERMSVAAAQRDLALLLIRRAFGERTHDVRSISHLSFPSLLFPFLLSSFLCSPRFFSSLLFSSSAC